MPLSNVSVVALDELTAEQVADLSAETLLSLQEEFDAQNATFKRRFAVFAAALEQRYGDRAAAIREAQKKDTGTVNLSDDGLNVACELRKKVEWDQDALAALYAKIKAAGDDPAIYMQTEYKIKEAAYASWPDHYKQAFMPARTVKPENPKFKINRSKK